MPEPIASPGVDVPLSEQRFWSRVAVGADGDCWMWQGALNGRAGYGAVSWHGRSASAHRVAYELTVGPIPPGLHIDHLCRNRRCVNPAHLEPVTRRENTLRGIGFAAVNARKEQCDRGHPFDETNTAPDRSGGVVRGRRCRACQRIRSARSEVRW